ncbi:MAG TPA: hypothetical protein VEG68_12140 [Terriglobales bacterium]|nr:hypothetical protein [Terriglobales bacterium]
MTRFDRTIVLKTLAKVCLFTAASIAAIAQDTTLPPGPVTVITQAEYEQMVQEGVKFFPVTPAIRAKQSAQRLARYDQNQAVLADFIANNPNLQDFDNMVESTPTSSNVFELPDGDYFTRIPKTKGGTQAIETEGQDSVLQDVATSIQASSDPVRELALYKSLYSGYANLYGEFCSPTSAPNPGCANLIAPSQLVNPSQLGTGSLAAIKSALQTIALQGPNIYKILPVNPLGSGTVAPSCSGDVGENLTLTEKYYGDQTLSSCNKPNAEGILANFSWPYENQLTCIKEQGQRGLCHIFASVSALEQLIARDTGTYVNLSEEDFDENESLVWNPSFFHDGGNPQTDLNNAEKNGYFFAYENQWDYNPSLSRTRATGFLYSCNNYPYPSLEPGCSDTTPQAPEYCVPVSSTEYACYLALAPLSGTRSPYLSNGAVSTFDPSLLESDPGFNSDIVIIELATNNAVVLGFKLTYFFGNDVDSGYVWANCAGNGLCQLADLLTSEGGHVVHIVAFISNEQLAANSATSSIPPDPLGLGYFVIKNSWGTCSGDDGFYYMPAGYLEDRATGIFVVNDPTD